MIPLSTLNYYPDNPRIWVKKEVEKLKKSLVQFPQMMEIRPFVVDENRNILSGNMKKRAFLELGINEVPENWVKFALGLTEQQKREFIIKDNTHYGRWDWEQVCNEWDGEPLEDWGLNIINEWDGEKEPEEKEKDNSITPFNICPECGQKVKETPF